MSDIKTQLEKEIASTQWQDLIPHAQRDAIVIAHSSLDLVEVGVAIATDNTQTVQNWISEQLLQKPTAQQLSEWNQEPNRKFTTIIVQPFVIISGDS